MLMYNTLELVLLIGFISFFLSLNYFILMLLSLEFIMLVVFVMISYFSFSNNFGSEYIFMFLSMMICEGVFGLCVLVSFTRYEGSDMFKFSL